MTGMPREFQEKLARATVMQSRMEEFIALGSTPPFGMLKPYIEACGVQLEMLIMTMEHLDMYDQMMHLLAPAAASLDMRLPDIDQYEMLKPYLSEEDYRANAADSSVSHETDE